jgi:outer membrane protein OmpA-like peptidoglycan-associated protein
VQAVDARATARGEALAGPAHALHGRVHDLRGTERSLAIPFAFAHAGLSRSAHGRLVRLARTLATRPHVRIAVAGHADAIGHPDVNQRLSLRRARTVCRTLRHLLGRDRRCAARGFGERAPIACNITPDGRDDPRGRALNRRARIVLRGRRV